jgi:hypothetical protein
MKQYYRTAQPGVIFDPVEGFGFEEGSPAHARYLAEVKAGEAELVDRPKASKGHRRRQAYQQDGLTADAWLEAVVEFLGTLEPKPPKFAALWAKREAVRSRVQ